MDLQQAFDTGFAAVKVYVDKSFASFERRMKAMENQLAALPAPKDGIDGKDADQDAVAEAVASIITDNMRKDFDELRAAVDAIPALPDVPALIEEALAVSEGKILQQCNAMVDTRVELEVAALPPAEKGKDADPVEVAAQIAAEVERAVAALPAPKDGQSVTLDDVRPLIDEAVTKAVTLIPAPKDGVDGKDGRNGLDAVKFFRDDKGHLIVVKSDGSTDDLGEYVGKDGAPGRDGVDGFGFEDMSEELADDGRTIVRRYSRGDLVKEFRHAVSIVLDRGVFKEGQTYVRGDGVTWAGCYWIAKEQTDAKPEPNGGPWRLSVKRGRDGKDGIMKDPPKGGPVKVG